jgi:asparagine synthase (glutamine-hydrolysing)
VTLADGRITQDYPPLLPFRYQPETTLDQAVSAATTILRRYLESFLEDHPDAVLQLTGGQDSRILLGAIPPGLRRGLKVMTLSVPGSPDVEIAADLARRYQLDHQIVTLDGLEQVTPDEAHTMVIEAARRLECSSDPLAWASLAFAEAKIEQSPRLSGLGGEVTRGFYYFGRVSAAGITRERVRTLAEWRMFTNEAVPDGVLQPEFARWAHEIALDELSTILTGYGPDWLGATDQFYLSQRMHRWAGVLATSTCLDRVVVNPMLDDRFLDVARGLDPKDKKSSRFLSRLSCSLDPELSAIPLDGRPAPAVYAYPSPANSARLALMTGRKISGKVRQRLLRTRRAPAGGEVLAARLTDYYRANPAVLESVAKVGILSAEWLEQVAAGTRDVAPAAAALLVNLEVATGCLDASG